MSVRTPIRGHFSKCANAIIALRHGPHFNCSDCERNERCGEPSGDDCVIKAMQIERDGNAWLRRRVAREFFQRNGIFPR